jgi:hypothetical protein
MKINALLLLTLMILLAGCAPQGQPTEDPAAPTGEDTDSLDEVLIHRLAVNLGLEQSEIVLIKREEVEFGDLCLDVARFDTVCAQAVTPGHIFIFEANGLEYEYRTTAAGDSIQPATLALTWTRDGGIAGFCDRLAVYLSGEVYASNCRSQPEQTSGYFTELLTAAQIKEFNAWYLEYSETTLDESDPAGVSDRMTNTLEFFGDGTRKPGRVDQQALFDWAKTLYQKLNS